MKIKNNIETAILFLDQEKAFHGVNHEFLSKSITKAFKFW